MMLAYLRKNVDGGVPEAMNQLGDFYRFGRVDGRKHPNKAAKLYTRAAELGNLDAMNNLGFMHSQEGLLGEADKDLAMELWLAAADRGHARAQANLGRELLRRATSRLHYCEAVAYLKLAAAQGYGEYDLAQCYANGRGVSVDLREARKWYARAAARGEEGAAAEVARIDAYYGDDPRSEAESSDGSDDDVRAILARQALSSDGSDDDDDDGPA
jgi:TPR repeat protein